MECVLRFPICWILIHARDEIQRCKVRGRLLGKFSEAVAIQRASIPYEECSIDLLLVLRIDAIVPEVMLEVILR